MVKHRPLLICLLALAAAVAAFLVLHESDEEKIEDRLEELAALCSKKGPENPLTAAAAAKQIADCFTYPLHLDIPNAPYGNLSGNFSRRDLRAYVLSGRAGFRKIEVRLYDPSVSIAGKTLGRATFTARLTARQEGTGLLSSFHELVCEVQKVEKEWLVQSVAEIRVLER
jgi:hypothetical protein